MKTFLSFLALSFFVFTTQAQSKWQTFESYEGKFKIKFPTKPELETKEKDDYTTLKVSCEKGNTSYFTAASIHNISLTEREELAKVSLEAFNEKLSGDILEQEMWVLKKNNGIQALIALPSEVIVEYRAIVIGQVQYQIIAFYPTEEREDKSLDKYFKSFKPKK